MKDVDILNAQVALARRQAQLNEQLGIMLAGRNLGWTGHPGLWAGLGFVGGAAIFGGMVWGLAGFGR